MDENNEEFPPVACQLCGFQIEIGEYATSIFKVVETKDYSFPHKVSPVVVPAGYRHAISECSVDRR